MSRKVGYGPTTQKRNIAFRGFAPLSHFCVRYVTDNIAVFNRSFVFFRYSFSLVALLLVSGVLRAFVIFLK